MPCYIQHALSSTATCSPDFDNDSLSEQGHSNYPRIHVSTILWARGLVMLALHHAGRAGFRSCGSTILVSCMRRKSYIDTGALAAEGEGERGNITRQPR
jgi:hypothetical protein